MVAVPAALSCVQWQALLLVITVAIVLFMSVQSLSLLKPSGRAGAPEPPVRR